MYLNDSGYVNAVIRTALATPGLYMIRFIDSSCQGTNMRHLGSLAPTPSPVNTGQPASLLTEQLFMIYEKEQSQGYNRRTMYSFTNFSSNKNV